MPLFDDLMTEVDAAIRDRNHEVLDSVSTKLDVCCRFVYNFYQIRKLDKKISKLRPLCLQGSCLEQEQRQTELSLSLDQKNECRLAVRDMQPCGICLACQSIQRSYMPFWQREIGWPRRLQKRL